MPSQVAAAADLFFLIIAMFGLGATCLAVIWALSQAKGGRK